MAVRGREWQKICSVRIQEEFTEYRKRYPGITQKGFAQNVLDMSEATFSQIMNGERNPSVDNLIKIANSFEVDVDYLIGNTSLKRRPTSRRALMTDTICQQIGLSVKAIEKLKSIVSDADGTLMDAINEIVESQSFTTIVKMIRDYLLYYPSQTDERQEAELFGISFEMSEEDIEDLMLLELRKQLVTVKYPASNQKTVLIRKREAMYNELDEPWSSKKQEDIHKTLELLERLDRLEAMVRTGRNQKKRKLLRGEKNGKD